MPQQATRHFRPFMACLAALLLLATGGAQASKLAPPDWELVNQRDDIKVYVRHGQLSKLKTFKGVVRMKIADEYALATLLNDYDNYPLWLRRFDGAREVRRNSPLHRFMHLTTDLPWPVADRDMGVELNVRQSITPREETIVIDIRSKDDLLPPQKGYVRVKQINGTLSFRRLENNEFEVTFEALFDPAGRIPLWMVNIMAADIPYSTLSQLRRFMAKPDYPAQFIDYLELRGATRPANLPPARSYLYENPPAEPIPALTLEQVNRAR